MNKIKGIVLFLIAFLMTVININYVSAATTLQDVAQKLSDTDLYLLRFDRTAWQKNPSENTNISYDNTGSQYTVMSKNTDYWIKYPNSLSYRGRNLTVAVNVKLIN
jgi:hypothetical protein